MTEEQRQAALEAIDRLEEDAIFNQDNCFNGVNPVEDVNIIRSALRAPQVPVIEGLEEAIERGSNPQMTGNEALDLFERGDFAKIIKAAHAYAELQKGEQK